MDLSGGRRRADDRYRDRVVTDHISPKLFTATFDSIFRRLNWENKGLKIDGEFLSNLRFADDIIILFLCTETPQELQQMLQERSDEHRKDKGDGCRQHPYKREDLC